MALSAPTLTKTVSRTRRRAYSLTLLGGHVPSLLHDLPAEIIINILELCLLNDQPGVLALISRIIHQYLNLVIYRSVILDSPHRIALFHRTVSSPRSSSLLTNVKRLAITLDPEYFSPTTTQQARQIVAGCTSLCTLAAPSCAQLSAPSSSEPIPHDYYNGPTELTFQSFEELPNPDPSSIGVDTLPAHFSTSLTYLRICEPGNAWQSPSSIITALNDAPRLRHLQLARRAESNEDNDIIFANDIESMLATRKNLKLVVVSIFPGLLGISPVPIQESNIWLMMEKIRAVDSRLVLLEGEFGQWKEEWKDAKSLRTGGQPIDFWKPLQ